ncbi:hypothetical protein J6590_087630 [Homalodisca vitripennis]|nr:hypothetical protein J6590_087630 [Homalodisca vitripennis]
MKAPCHDGRLSGFNPNTARPSVLGTTANVSLSSVSSVEPRATTVVFLDSTRTPRGRVYSVLQQTSPCHRAPLHDGRLSGFNPNTARPSVLGTTANVSLSSVSSLEPRATTVVFLDSTRTPRGRVYSVLQQTSPCHRAPRHDGRFLDSTRTPRGRVYSVLQQTSPCHRAPRHDGRLSGFNPNTARPSVLGTTANVSLSSVSSVEPRATTVDFLDSTRTPRGRVYSVLQQTSPCHRAPRHDGRLSGFNPNTARPSVLGTTANVSLSSVSSVEPRATTVVFLDSTRTPRGRVYSVLQQTSPCHRAPRHDSRLSGFNPNTARPSVLGTTANVSLSSVSSVEPRATTVDFLDSTRTPRGRVYSVLQQTSPCHRLVL